MQVLQTEEKLKVFKMEILAFLNVRLKKIQMHYVTFYLVTN